LVGNYCKVKEKDFITFAKNKKEATVLILLPPTLFAFLAT